MNSSFSSAPFTPAESRRVASAAVVRRVFTRSPFATAGAPRLLPGVTTLPLQRRDRSLYAWFESGGMVLTLTAIGAAVTAILIG